MAVTLTICGYLVFLYVLAHVGAYLSLKGREEE